jgi:CHASE2 domain-containing sensor protein
MHKGGVHGLKFNVLGAVVLALCVTAVVTALERLHLLPHEPDKFIYDWKVSLLSKTIAAQRRDIAIIYIDDASLSRYPYKSPIDRALLAAVIRAVDRTKPKAIGVDIIFDRPTEQDRDDALLDALHQAHSPIVLIRTDAKESGVRRRALEWQEHFLKSADKIVANPFLGAEDSSLSLSDYVIRDMAAFDERDDRYPPFALALARIAGDRQYPANQLIDWLLPPADGREVFLTFVAPALDKVSAADDGDELVPPFMQKALSDRIVIIAGDVAGVDWYRVPMTVSNNLEAPGGYIHAQILAQLLDGRQIKDLPEALTTAIVFLTTFLLYFAIETLGERHPEIIIEFVVIGLAMLFGVLLFWLFRLNFPSSQLAMVWLLAALSGKYTSAGLGRIQNRLFGE